MSRRSDRLDRIEAAQVRIEAAADRIETALTLAVSALTPAAADAKGARSSAEAALAGVKGFGSVVTALTEQVKAAMARPAPQTVMTPAVKAGPPGSAGTSRGKGAAGGR